MNQNKIAIFSVVTDNARKKAEKAKRDFSDTKEKHEEMKKILEKNFSISGSYPSDLFEQYKENVSILKEKSQIFADASDLFHRCVQQMQNLQDQK